MIGLSRNQAADKQQPWPNKIHGHYDK